MSEIEKALAVKEKSQAIGEFLQAGSISGTRSLKAMTGL